jgi:hypothetical protein
MKTLPPLWAVQGFPLMWARAWRAMLPGVPRYLLEHRHSATECGAVFAAFNAFHSPLRGRSTTASCHYGGHRIWWEVEAGTEVDALARLPRYVAERTTASRVRPTRIP